ncbi:hypothetical protein WN51_05391 [Melipona quadrifasciata]|uniref:Uncharacterized protein n=1 Tax=Melipona quadrifasciata TaxID=166423 RepID=A0A0M8ZT59_9HYME|nr:hypothetical protein WN51_05391 [Melipona quadrifasciata]
MKEKIEEKKTAMKTAKKIKHGITNKFIEKGISFSDIVARTKTTEKNKETDHTPSQLNQNATIELIKSAIETTIQNQIDRLFEHIEDNASKIATLAEAFDIQF